MTSHMKWEGGYHFCDTMYKFLSKTVILEWQSGQGWSHLSDFINEWPQRQFDSRTEKKIMDNLNIIFKDLFLKKSLFFNCKDLLNLFRIEF